jgi:hypothetical protein
VKTARLEPLLDGLGVGRVDLLKMDIEGAEALVLPTLAEGLSRHHYKAILLELHPQILEARGVRASELVAGVLSHGYGAWRVDHSPEAFRRAAYRLPSSPRDVLTRFDPLRPLDAWPHLLFLAPDVVPGW